MLLLSTFVLLISMLQYTSSDELQEMYYKEKKCASKCIFRGDLNSKTIDLFPSTCSRVCSFLKINKDTDVSEERLNKAFKNMTVLLGGLEITYTNYTSGNFLSSLEEIDGFNSIMMHSNNEMTEIEFTNLRYLKCFMMNIYSNNKMERITMRKIVNVTWDTKEDILIFIFSPYPDFCLDTGAAKVFTKIREPSTINIYARYFCEPKFDERMCRTPRNGCVELFGDVVVGPFFNMTVMKYVEVIYGSLIIKNSNLMDFDDFESFQYIISLNPLNPVLLVEGNSELMNASFPKIQKIKSAAMEAVVFDGNNPELSSNSSACFMLQDVLSSNSETGITFDGNTCEQMEEILFDTTTTTSTVATTITTEISVVSTTTQKSSSNGMTYIDFLMKHFVFVSFVPVQLISDF